MNSVVLKQQSPWLEYYYRSIRDGEHYLEYNLSSVLPLLRRLQVGKGSGLRGGQLASMGEWEWKNGGSVPSRRPARSDGGSEGGHWWVL